MALRAPGGGVEGVLASAAAVVCPACGSYVRRGFYPVTTQVCPACRAVFSQGGPGLPPVVVHPDSLRCPRCGEHMGTPPPGTALMCLRCGQWSWDPGDRKTEEVARQLAGRQHRPPVGSGPLRGDVLARVRALVRSECAGYHGAAGRCVFGRPCVYCGEEAATARCWWFEVAVLPLDPRLLAEYCHGREVAGDGGKGGARADGGGQGLRARACVACGREFVPASNRQVYCADCSVRARREAVARAVARHRARVGAGVNPTGV